MTLKPRSPLRLACQWRGPDVNGFFPTCVLRASTLTMPLMTRESRRICLFGSSLGQMTNNDKRTILAERRVTTSARLGRVREQLIASNTDALLGEAACIYATGSVGRGEASNHSDLDVFIVSDVNQSNTSTHSLDTSSIIDRLVTAAADAEF